MEKRYTLPDGMRYSTLRERKMFYSQEFDIDNVFSWIAKHRNPMKTVFAVVIGRHTGIFPKRFEKFTKAPVLVDEYGGPGDVWKQIGAFLPEGVYYDRNIYRDLRVCAKCKKRYENCWGCPGFSGQELAFDIDPENIPCPKCGTLAEKMGRGQGLGFCEHELRVAKEQARKLSGELRKRFGRTEVVYSGRGYHVHVFDRNAETLSIQERSELAREMKNRGYYIDSWITEGSSRLIRLPYSLHGMVSRVVFPVKNSEMPAFDPVKDPRCRPKFL
ncbi:MAG: DNA primase [Candidatus Micrarchaeota archaeon]